MKTERTGRLPPFFTQVIGSLPRPKVVQDLLARRSTIPAPRFHQLLDEMVLFAIRLQEQAGIDVISDGEWRRSHYIGEFLARIGGFEKCRPVRASGRNQIYRRRSPPHFRFPSHLCRRRAISGRSHRPFHEIRVA